MLIKKAWFFSSYNNICKTSPVLSRGIFSQFVVVCVIAWMTQLQTAWEWQCRTDPLTLAPGHWVIQGKQAGFWSREWDGPGCRLQLHCSWESWSHAELFLPMWAINWEEQPRGIAWRTEAANVYGPVRGSCCPSGDSPARTLRNFCWAPTVCYGAMKCNRGVHSWSSGWHTGQEETVVFACVHRDRRRAGQDR